MKIYYAHPISIYNTMQEERDLKTIKKVFPNDEIFNPNCKECEAGYKKHGMDYFNQILETCDSVIFRAMANNKIPAGIAKEVSHFTRNDLPIIELPTCITTRVLSVDETREFLKECGYR